MDKAERNYNIIKEFALEKLYLSLFGVTETKQLYNDMSDELRDASNELIYAISVAFKLSDAVIDSLVDHPTRLYMHHYQAVNRYLDSSALLIGKIIEELGGKYIAVPASLFLSKEEKHRSHLSHRTAAYFAGLGWIGRNNLLVTPEFGSRVRLVTILTDLELKTDTPMEFGCGDCYECIKACPAGALTENGYDFEKCFKLLSYFVGKYNVGHHICGLCVKACRGKR